MSLPVSSALQRIAERISQPRLTASVQSLGLLRDALIDVYGCMLIGARQQVATRTHRGLLEAGLIDPRHDAPIFGTRLRAAAGHAAMANAVAGHALEFDDWEVPGNTHVSVLLAPAILAVSAGRRLSGDEFVTAYLAGYETIARIGEAINFEHYQRGWHATATIGALGVAGAVACLLSLDGSQTANALAIATSRALGYNAQFGSETKPLQVGFAVEGGILAARLAAAGLSGQVHMLDHAAGMAALMGGPGPLARLADIVPGPEAAAAIDEHLIVFKPWPSCGYTHRIMTGMLTLRETGLDPEQIEAIELQLPDTHAAILPYRQPANREQALFSLPYCAAMALIFGDLTLDDLERETWHTSHIRRLIEVTRITGFSPRRPDLNYDPEEPDRIRVEAGGECHEIEVPYPLGAPQKPFDNARHERKFAFNSGLGETRGGALWRRLRSWPEADDLHSLFSAQPTAD